MGRGQRHPAGCACDQPWHHTDPQAIRAKVAEENRQRLIRRAAGKATLHDLKLRRADSAYTVPVGDTAAARQAALRTYARRRATRAATDLLTLDPKLWTAEARERIAEHARAIRTIIEETT